jgi:acyl carrier protein
MEQTLTALLAEIFDKKEDEISDDLCMKDLEVWDSLKHMELVAGIEHAFGVEFSFEEIVMMRSVREIKDVLRKRGVSI